MQSPRALLSRTSSMSSSLRTAVGSRTRTVATVVCATVVLGTAGTALAAPATTAARATTASTATTARAAAAPAGLPLISRGLPAYASSDRWEPAPRANDDDYGTGWRSVGTPATLAYDLSTVPVARRGRVLAAWSNTSYGYSTRYGVHYNNLGSYTIETNSAAGGGAAPTTGWVTKVTVAGNTLHSRQHLLDLGGANWVRLSVTASDGSSLNTDAAVNMFDLYDASSVAGNVADDFIFYGDSITAGSMCPCPQDAVAALPSLIHGADASRWPVMENGGDPYVTSAVAVSSILGTDGYLSLFPGTYVGLSYGMNDAASSTGQDAYYTNMKQLVQGVLAAGKIPMIPTISYTDDATRNAVIPSYNAVIARLYAEFPQIVHGPDLWTFFSDHHELLGTGDIHPNAAGYGALRQQWASTLLASVYGGGTSAAPVAAPSPSPTAAPAASPSPSASTAPVPVTGAARSGLHAVGNRIVDAGGATVRMIGVNHSGTEYSCVGGGSTGAAGYGVFEPADFGTNPAYLDAIKTWGSNTVRLGLNEACWLGIDGVDPAFSGAAYRDAVHRFVDMATARGLNTVLELHWSAPGTGASFVPHGQAPMPDRDHSPEFWRQVATTFKANTAVAFDLFNEPFPRWNQDTADAWACWRDGTVATDPTNTSHCLGTEWWDTNGNAFNGGKAYVYAVAGMQELVDAVRSTGAGNLVLLSGLQYANSLSQWNSYKPVDPAGNLAASWHVYSFNSCSTSTCWDAQVAPVAAASPLVTSEIGDQNCGTSFVDPLMTWLDGRGAGYLAWTWNAWGCNGLQLMTDYTSGAPTALGKPVYDHFRKVTAAPVAGPTPSTTPAPAPVPTVSAPPAPTTSPAPVPSPTPTSKGGKKKAASSTTTATFTAASAAPTPLVTAPQSTAAKAAAAKAAAVAKAKALAAAKARAAAAAKAKAKALAAARAGATVRH